MTILKKISLVLMIAAAAAACSDSKIDQADIKNDTSLSFTDTIPPDSTVIGFLRWYRDNEERLHQIPLLTGGLQDTTTFYSVDFKATERYLSELKKSGYISDIFLDDLRNHFIKSNEYLKQHPQNDGPAPGFEADLIMKAQDYMDVWTNLDKAKVIDKKINGSKATMKLVFIGNYKTRYFLTLDNNKWLLDQIENAFAED